MNKLSTRTQNVLKALGLKTRKDVFERKERWLLQQRGMGKYTFNEILCWMDEEYPLETWYNTDSEWAINSAKTNRIIGKERLPWMNKDKWQPIDTAPKDFTLILIGWYMWSGRPGDALQPCVAFWSESANVWMNNRLDMGRPDCWLPIPSSFSMERPAKDKYPESKGLMFTEDRE